MPIPTGLGVAEFTVADDPGGAIGNEGDAQDDIVPEWILLRSGAEDVGDALVDAHAPRRCQRSSRRRSASRSRGPGRSQRGAAHRAARRLRRVPSSSSRVSPQFTQRVDSLGEHGGAAGDRGGNELGDRDQGVGRDRAVDHECGRTSGHAYSQPGAALGVFIPSCRRCCSRGAISRVIQERPDDKVDRHRQQKPRQAEHLTPEDHRKERYNRGHLGRPLHDVRRQSVRLQ